MKKPTDRQYRDAAKREYHKEGSLEIDSLAPISRGDGQGAYVQAWIWIADDVAVRP